MIDQTKRVEAACWGLTLGQFGLAFAIHQLGPEHPLPMHFDLQGQVDRWGDKSELVGIVLTVAIISGLTSILRSIWARNRESSVRWGLLLSQLAVAWIMSLIALLAACLTWGWVDEPGPKFAMAVISSAIALIGAALGKVSPNAMVGVRTPWTYSSRLAWDKSNRLAGRLFFWGGLVGLVAIPFAPQPDGFRAMILGVLAIAGLTVFESWRVWRNDPQRQPL